MIIENGTIEAIVIEGGGYDPITRYVIPITEKYDRPIPCQYEPIKINQLGTINGEHYTQAAYKAYIDVEHFNADRIRLKDYTGNIVGDFSVIEIKPLATVCQTLIYF